MRYIRLSAVLLLAACGDGGTTPTSPPTPPTPVATSITLSATSLSFSSLGATQQLTATVKDQNGATMSGASVSWATSSASVATVSSSGLVTSVADGSATITATSGSANGTAAVTVAVPASLELSDTLLTFSALGDTTQLTATVKNAAGSTISAPTVSWATSDDAVATVSSAGLVTSVANGSATVTATSGEVSDTVAVTVLQTATSVELSDTLLTFPSLGDTATLTAAVKDDNGTEISGAAVTWATSDTTVATVSDGGLVTAVTNGTATITATSGTLEATAAATVAQVASSLVLSDTVLTFASLTDTTQLTAVVKDANANVISGATVSWATSDTTIATVSDAGLVTSVANGTATITATSGSVSATAAVTVSQVAASITLSPPDSLVFVTPGDTATVMGTVKDALGSVMAVSPTLTWSSSDTTVVTVNSSGLVTAVASVLATITAQTGDLQATLKARVKGSNLEVTVTGDGDPLPDVSVWLTDPTGTNTKKTTDAAGTVLYRNLQPGEHTVTLQGTPATLTLTPASPQTIQVAEDQGHDLVFTGAFAPAQITGTAKSWGTPVEGAVVRVEGKDTVEVTVNSVGVFQVDSIRRGATGNYTLTISNYSGVRFKETKLTQTLESGANTAEFVGKPDPEPTWASVDGGDYLTCGVTAGGEAYCWGRNASGQLGDGTTTDSSVPVLVSGGHTWASVSGGGEHTCGMTTADEAYCWGDNFSGQLGDGTTTDRTIPTVVSGGYTWASVKSSCGVTTAGAAYCWGANYNGQLGDGTTDQRLTPVLVSGGHTWASVSSVGSDHTCGVTTGDEGYCWGSNRYGQLGNGGTGTHTEPTIVIGGYTWASVNGGVFYTCGVTTFGEAYCWGRNDYGRLGDGTTTDRTTPGLVSGGITTWASVNGADHTCGVTTAGVAYCWGKNGNGQLGDGTTTNSSVPVLVSGEHTWAAVTAVGRHSCGVTAAGEAYCWGRNDYGQLGDGTTANNDVGYSRSVPVKVGGNW